MCGELTAPGCWPWAELARSACSELTAPGGSPWAERASSELCVRRARIALARQILELLLQLPLRALDFVQRGSDGEGLVVVTPVRKQHQLAAEQAEGEEQGARDPQLRGAPRIRIRAVN